MNLKKIFKNHSRKLKVVFGVLVSFACLCLFSLNGIQAKEPGAVSSASRGLKVGVVDLNAVFEKYEKERHLILS